MSEKKPFFFDPEPATTTSPRPTVGSGLFFDALKNAGVVQDADAAMPVKADGEMKEKATRYLIIEYGIYQNDYSLHLTPCDERKNLDTPTKVELAVVAALQVIKPLVPDQMRIDVYLPREDWKMKVVSVVIRGAATSWNFNPKAFEEGAVLPLFDAVQKVILS